MKYNSKYDRYVDYDFVIYYYDKNKDKLVQCCTQFDKDGYLIISVSKPKRTHVKVHRLIYETFVGEIPEGMVIDHINTERTDNRLENIRCVTVKENNNNTLTKKHLSEAQKGKPKSAEHRKKISESRKGKGIGNKNNRGKATSEFGIKFKEHFGICPYLNKDLYYYHRNWYKRHNNTCKWEDNHAEG